MRRLLGERPLPVVALVVASVVSALAEAGILAIAAQVATSLVARQSRVTFDLGAVTLHTTVTSLLLLALVLAIVRLLLQGVASYYTARIASDVQAQMKRELFAAFSVSAWDTQSSDREGHFQELMTSQVFQAAAGSLNAAVLIVSICTVAILAVSAIALNAIAAVAVLAAASGLFVALRPLTALGARLSRELSQAQIEYAGVVSDAGVWHGGSAARTNRGLNCEQPSAVPERAAGWSPGAEHLSERDLHHPCRGAVGH
jgi:ABC-type multidrug transport system fused ATPase/permease subunit